MAIALEMPFAIRKSVACVPSLTLETTADVSLFVLRKNKIFEKILSSNFLSNKKNTYD